MFRIIALCLLTFSFAGFGQNKSILYIGNSYTGVNNLPLLVYNLALENEDTITYDSNTPGGSRFETHKTNPTTLSKIASEDWDFVVLQDQSQIPALPELLIGSAYSPTNAAVLNDSIKSNSECTEVVFYLTWGRKYGDASFCDDYPPVCTYEGMQEKLTATYVLMANENDATVAPAGEAWKAVINDDPDIELYSGDESHPNINGSYLAACVMYATIYRKSVIGNPYTAGLDEGLALYLQEKADEVVFGMADIWRIGDNDLVADFNYENEGLTFEFNNLSTNDLYWEWTIEGTVYSEENPTHTFDAAGEYEVIFMVYNECDTIIQTETITVGPAGINTNSLLAIEIYPNPTNNFLTIKSSSTENIQVDLYDLKGVLIYSGNFNSQHKIDLGTYDRGIYILRIDTQTYRVVKI